MVAAVDGMRFVVPVPAAFARPNRKFFGPKRGMTSLNAMNDQGIELGAKIVSGTPCHGAYNFLLPDLAPGAIRDLGDPDAPDDDEE